MEPFAPRRCWRYCCTALVWSRFTGFEAIVFPLTPHRCHYLKAFREGKMRSYAAWLQSGHTTWGSCSLCLTLPHTFHSAFTLRLWISCRVFCHVLVITALVLSYTANLNTLTPFKVTLLNPQAENKLFPALSLCFTMPFSLFSVSHSHIFWHRQIVRGQRIDDILLEERQQALFVIIQL